jgi:DNA repair protein RadA/Sms
VSYACTKCGGQHDGPRERCQRCGAWDTVRSAMGAARGIVPIMLGDIVVPDDYTKRVHTPWPSLDRVLGGGFVPGRGYLLFADPGWGKSTLGLQLCETFQRPLYVTGEESQEAIANRAGRIKIKRRDVPVWETSDFDRVLKYQAPVHQAPDYMVVDSAQVMRVDPSVGAGLQQVEAVVKNGTQWAHKCGAVVLFIAQINKQFEVAGLKSIEHAVDCVLYGAIVEGDQCLTVLKNRDGPRDEMCAVAMTERGLAFTEE